jgi:putative tryptophan/tyrosine transport system substrate-binding protein
VISRRAFVAAGLSACFAPRATLAQPTGRVYRIGLLMNSSAPVYAKRTEAFQQGLCDLGYVEGTNVVLEYRWSEGNQDRLPELAAELVRRFPS